MKSKEKSLSIHRLSLYRLKVESSLFLKLAWTLHFHVFPDFSSRFWMFKSDYGWPEMTSNDHKIHKLLLWWEFLRDSHGVILPISNFILHQWALRLLKLGPPNFKTYPWVRPLFAGPSNFRLFGHWPIFFAGSFWKIWTRLIQIDATWKHLSIHRVL